MESSKLEAIRHSLAHLLAAAVTELYPNTLPTLGPAIDNGFYYDFDNLNLTEKDLERIEQKMRQIGKTWSHFEKEELTPDQARELFKNNPYKLELIEEIISKKEPITVYHSILLKAISDKLKASFTDLCRGGHADDFSQIDLAGFKLDRIAGAYWRGDEKNKMLTRVYGLAFENKEALENYVAMLEEAKKRDHKILGKTLKLFTSSELVGAGLPLIQPNGMVLRDAVEKYLWELHKNKGYDRVWTPHLAKEALYETSGHAAKFGDELFRVHGKEEHFFLKPMNCPHHMQIFADNQWSYRDMPVRYFEPATVYRDEKSGQLGGLTRVRSITQDDGHLFCRVNQIKDEVGVIVEIIKEFYTTFNLLDGYWVRLSVRGEDKSKYLGSDEVWEKAEAALEDAAKKNDLNYRRVEGEAAFYGPKLDFIFKDAVGREWQLATIQCDFNLPERFDLSYINEAGEKERPVVIHRAISGALERFLGIIIEHYAGAFPTWLSPLQVAILPLAHAHEDYAAEMAAKLKAADIRVKIYSADETLGKRIREVKTTKPPYFLVIGDKEKDSGNLTIESRAGDKSELSLSDLLAKLETEIKERK